jgi:hypothetical protein
LKSNFASVLEIVACIALRRPVAGLSAGIAGSRIKLFVAASPPRGGGRFFGPGAGAGRLATGSIDRGGGTMGSSGSLRDLKLRFVRNGVEEGVYTAEVDIVEVKKGPDNWLPVPTWIPTLSSRSGIGVPLLICQGLPKDITKQHRTGLQVNCDAHQRSLIIFSCVR